MHMRTRWAALAAVTLFLTGCGGDGEGGGGEAATEIDTVASDYAFDPDSWTVPSGETITLTLANEGDELHEWAILEQGTTIERSTDLDEDTVVWEIEAEPGSTETGEFTAPSPGTYQIVCALPGHVDAGMEGTLDVVEGAS
jgi:uncharacterized cupredoxin-like copper-binding protein